MHVVLEGDQLSGKTTVALELRRYNRLATIIENRGLAVTEEDIRSNTDLDPHFFALSAFTEVAFRPCIILRGPISAYANGLIGSDSLKRVSLEILGSDKFVFFWLDISYDTYTRLCKTYVRKLGFRPHTRAMFEMRRARYAEAVALLSGCAWSIALSQGDYRAAADAIANRVGWDRDLPILKHMGGSKE